jgi:hypothetical protein
MTKQDLPGIKGVVDEIESLQKDLSDIDSLLQTRYVADTVKGSSMRFPYMEHVLVVGGVDEVRLSKQRKKLSRRLKITLMRMQLIRDDAYKLIDEQEDADIRTILRLKYINGLTWPEIAAEVHMSDRTARRHLKDWWAK